MYFATLKKWVPIVAGIATVVGVGWTVFGPQEGPRKDKSQMLHQEVSGSESVSSQFLNSDGEGNTVVQQGPGSTINIRQPLRIHFHVSRTHCIRFC